MAANIADEDKLRDPLDSFTDREHILTHFTNHLRSTRPGDFRLLALKGHSGTGKTFLIEYLSKRVCPQAGWQTGVLAFAQSFPDFRTLLAGLEDALKRCVPHESLKQYRTLREEYNRRFDEYRATITVNQHIDANASSQVTDIQMRAQIDTKLRDRELQLRSELTRAILELAEECSHSLCLFIDGYERLVETAPDLVGWLWEEILCKLPQQSTQPVLIVTCGWEYPMSATLQPFTTYDELDDFDRLRVKGYLQAQDILPTDASQHEPLVTAFYDFTKGHPLVLALAVTYFQTLPEPERTPERLHTQSPLLYEEARVQWLEERLLKRLPEPHRTLLERGPILRSFNQATLQILLNLDHDGEDPQVILDDRTYAHFLQYPFINLKNAQGNTLLEQPTFHDLTRNVRLESLRRLHSETKQRLHIAIAGYYMDSAEAEKNQNTGSQAQPSNKAYAEWFTETPEQEFRAQLELCYHALQIEVLQADAFTWWERMSGQAITKWQHKQAGPLLELARQVAEEGEVFLNKQSDHYGQYLAWYSRLLEQEARWDEARMILQKAADVFEQQGKLSDQAVCLNNIGAIYDSQGQLDLALNYHQRALSLREQVGNPAHIAQSLNNIGAIYNSQGQLDLALDYYQRALSLFEQVGNPAAIATSLNNIGFIYRQQGQLDLALDYYQRALSLREQVGNPADIALQCHNLADLYLQQEQWQIAIPLFSKAESLYEQMGQGFASFVANELEGLAVCFMKLEDIETAKSYYIRATQIRAKLQPKQD